MTSNQAFYRIYRINSILCRVIKIPINLIQLIGAIHNFIMKVLIREIIVIMPNIVRFRRKNMIIYQMPIKLYKNKIRR